MLPIQIASVDIERAAIAPYNFVPLPSQVVPAEQREPVDQSLYDALRHTGHISCTLTTSSPLYVRSGLTEEQFRQGLEAKNIAEFFYILDKSKPVIPGSSLRGMLRALVEIAAYAKMDKVTDVPRYFYRAVAAKMDDPLASPYRAQLRNVRAGYLEQRGRDWYIRAAQSIGTEAYLKVAEQYIPRSVDLIRLHDPHYRLQVIPVSFTTKKLKPSPRNPQGRLVIDQIDKPGIHSYSGCMLTSGNMLETSKSGQRTQRKNHAVIGEASDGVLKIADTAVEDYRHGLSDFIIEQLGTNGVLQDGRPVFYCEPAKNEKEVVYFGHNPNFRLPYRFPGSERAATPLDFVPPQLRNDELIDMAEAMFGFVRRNKRNKDQAMAGRVFVHDAQLMENQTDIWYSDDPITPRVLASPKPTTFQHYLVQPSAVRPELKHYASSPTQDTVIRGHKLYWHKGDQPDIGLPADQQQTKDTQKTLIRPVRAGLSFSFDIRFENLSDIELGVLLWVLRIAADEHYRLKLGMGKPLGMGAVRIASQLVLNNRKQRYTALFDGESWATGNEDLLPPDAQTAYIQAFEKHILTESKDSSPDGKLENTLRIRCLLVLLKWPGPQPEMTRYMEIERDRRLGIIAAADPIERGQKVNEYKLRPVLPTPIQVENPAAVGTDSSHKQSQVRGSLPQQQAPGLAVPQIPAVGAILRLDIANADTESALLTIPGFTAEKVVGVIENLGGRQLKAGNTLWVKVLNVRTLKSGRVIVELEPTKERPI